MDRARQPAGRTARRTGRPPHLRPQGACARALPARRGRAALRLGTRDVGVAAAATAATPKRGGVLKFARNFEPVTLGPFGAADNGTIWTIMMIYDQLVEYQPGTFAPQPGLAKSWEFSNGGKTIVFHLRDAKFSDGSPVTAEDVAFSLNRFKDPKVNTLLPVPRDEHRLRHRGRLAHGGDEAQAGRRRHPLEPDRLPRLDHAQGGRDEARRQGLRAEPGRQRPVRRAELGARPEPEDEPQPALLAAGAAVPRRRRVRLHHERQHAHPQPAVGRRPTSPRTSPSRRSTRSTRARPRSRSPRSPRSTPSG